MEAWGTLLTDIPFVSVNMIRDIERCELPVSLRIELPKQIMDRVDRLVTRLSLSILLATLILGIALPVLIAVGNSVLLILAVVGFAAVVMLGAWLVISIVRYY